MSRSVKIWFLTLGLVVQLGLVALSAAPASAAVGPADDRQQSTPASWATYTGVTASQVNSYLSANNARLTPGRTGARQRH